MSLSPQTLPQGALWPANQFGPPNLGWSQMLDYGGGSAPLYILWYPVGSGQALNGYIQKLIYSGSSIIQVQWAVQGNPAVSKVSVNPTAVWANRATLNYV